MNRKITFINIFMILSLILSLCSFSSVNAQQNVPPAPPSGGSQGGPGGNGIGPGGNGSQTETPGNAANTINTDSTVDSGTYESTTSDENALRIENKATATITNATVNKSGDSSSTDNSNFYGLNAGILVRDGASAEIRNASVTTNSSGSNGVFSYGTASVDISDSKIRTSSNNSGGVEVAGGGTLTALNLDIETEGNSAAAIRSDRGGGTESVTKGLYVTNGTGSPAVYCTANITVNDATLKANSSEAVVIEGKNSVTLNNVDATGNMTGTYGGDQSENIHNVMIYQSMSGDASVGEGSFTMTDGSLTALSGDMFYITNTNAVISLTNVELTLGNDTLLTIAGNDASRGWGTAGSNGGTATFTADNQTMSGNITVDDISTLTLTMKNGTSYSGAINPDGQTKGTISVTIDSASTWTLTGDSYVTEFNGNISQVNANGHHLYVNGTAAD